MFFYFSGIRCNLRQALQQQTPNQFQADRKLKDSPVLTLYQVKQILTFKLIITTLDLGKFKRSIILSWVFKQAFNILFEICNRTISLKNASR